MEMFVYFSRLLNEDVMDKNRELAGKVYDLIAMQTEIYPRVCAMAICRGFFRKRYTLIPWENFAERDSKGIYLNCAKSSLVFSDTVDYQDKLGLNRDILDQQVIDIHNYNVIRVNDIHLLQVNHDLMVAHVDIGIRGLLRRLGYEKIIDSIVKLFSKNAPYLKKEKLISWKFVHPLSINPVSKTLKIDLPQKDFGHIPSAELGDIMKDLDPVQKKNLFKILDIKTQSKIFGLLDFKTQHGIVDDIGPKAGAEILKQIPDDEATDFLDRMPRRSVDQILDNMETKTVKKLSRLLGYASDSAGGLMTTDYLSINKDATVETSLNMIRERVFLIEPIQYIYIVDDERHLHGLTNLRRLLTAIPSAPVDTIKFAANVHVHLENSVREVAYLMDKYKYQALPVVNEEHILQGIITIDDILSQLIALAWRKTRRKLPRTL